MDERITLELAPTDAQWLRAILVESRWPVESFASVERVVEALTEAILPDDTADLPAITPQADVTLEAFVGSG